jgi:hypothetical protein
MISPFNVEEKQKLIETNKIEDKMKLLDEIVSFNIFELGIIKRFNKIKILTLYLLLQKKYLLLIFFYLSF